MNSQVFLRTMSTEGNVDPTDESGRNDDSNESADSKENDDSNESGDSNENDDSNDSNDDEDGEKDEDGEDGEKNEDDEDGEKDEDDEDIWDPFAVLFAISVMLTIEGPIFYCPYEGCFRAAFFRACYRTHRRVRHKNLCRVNSSCPMGDC